MYAVRVDTQGRRIDVQCSGRLTTEEAVRAVTQVAALMEAGDGITDVLCDLTQVRRGPGSLLLIAATIASRQRANYRIALVATAQQKRFAQRVVRFSGLRQGIIVLRSQADAAAWLEAGPLITSHRFSATELRHAEHLLGAGASGEAAAQEQPRTELVTSAADSAA